jgi:hypothetical protein
VWAIVCLAALLTAGPAAAQTVDGGIKAGMVAGRLRLDGAGAFETTARAGATGGGFVTVGLGRYWRVQLEALYAERRFRSSGLPVEIAVRSRGVEVPLLLQLAAPEGRRVRPLAFAGPQVSVVSSVRQTIGGVDTDISDDVLDLDGAAVAGVGVEIAAGRGAVVIDGRFVVGLKELNETPPPEYRSRAFTLLLGYRF